MRFRPFLCAALLIASTAAAQAQQRTDSAAFIIRLGHDTTVIERYTRTNDQLVVEAVQRSPSTLVHRMVVDVDAKHAVRRVVYTIFRPGSDQALLERLTTFDRDSATIVTNQGGTARTTRVAAVNAIPIAGPFFSPYELAMMRAAAGKAAKTNVVLLQTNATVSIPIERIGSDSLALTNQFGEPMRAHIDGAGRLLHLHTPAFTTVERLRWLDLDAFTRDFAARDASGKGLGALSPRQAYRTAVGEANIWVDYSRPGMRGRPIWGGLVPFGNVWRMGANDAAHFATDRALDIGGVKVEPGTYTLFLIPSADDWTLVINRRTRTSGLDYDASQDVGRVKLTKQTLERAVEQFSIEVSEAGTLSVAWDRVRGSVPIKVL